MSEEMKKGAVDRLITLGTELRMAYGKASDHVACILGPVESSVAEIGETWPPQHWAELAASGDMQDPERSPACFMHETFTNGEEAEYVLCVARNQDRTCGLHVSVCKSYRIHSNNGSDKVMVKDKRLLSPEKLPVPLRLRILDTLDDFAEAYELHVRDIRADVLGKWGEERHAEAVAEAAPKKSVAKRSKSKKKTKEEPANKPEEDPVPEATAEPEPAPQPAEADKKVVTLDPMKESLDQATEVIPEPESAPEAEAIPQSNENDRRVVALDPVGEVAYKPGEAFVLNDSGEPVSSKSEEHVPDGDLSLKAWF